MRSNELEKLKSQHIFRESFKITNKNARWLEINNQRFLNFASNDYLGLAEDPTVKEAFKEGAQIFGLGSSSSASLAGYYEVHEQFETLMARFLKRDNTILLNSGYHANLSIFRSICQRNHQIFADKYCHASLLDGIQLSKAKYKRYLHQDLRQLERYLKLNSIKNSTFVVTESVFSMSGNISPLKDIQKLTTSVHANIILDDAHGFGILGENGRGASDFFNLMQADLPFLIVPLAKALGGMGAVIAGSSELIDSIKQFAKPYRYTSALPPAISFAMLTALEILKKENHRRDRLLKLIQFFIKQCESLNIKLISNDLTPIKAILIGDNIITKQLGNFLLSKGFKVGTIFPPTVPLKTARLRISLSCCHEEEDIFNLLNQIKYFLCSKKI